MNELKDRIEATGMRIYNGSVDDDMLLHIWWMELHETGDIQDAFVESARSWRGFADTFAAPTMLLYVGRPIWFAMWFCPKLPDSAFVATWCAKRRRGTRAHVEVTDVAYRVGLAAYPTLFALTRLERVRAVLEKCGFTIMDYVPNVNHYIGYVTRETYSMEEYRHGKRRK